MTEVEARDRKDPWPSQAQKNNNPGLLQQWGSFPISQGAVVFPSAEVGMRELKKLVDRNIFERELSLYQLWCGNASFRGLLFEDEAEYGEQIALYMWSWLLSSWAPLQREGHSHSIHTPMSQYTL